MWQDGGRLREQADRDLAESGGIGSVLIYPVLALCLGLASDLWAYNPLLVQIFTLVTALIGGIRYSIGQQLLKAPPDRLGPLKRRYSASVLAVAASWSMYAAWIVNLYGRSWSGLLALMMTVGVVAASTSNLTPYFPLLRSYILVMVVPSAVTMASHGTPSELLTSACMLVFCMFMYSTGHRHATRYVRLSQALFDLEVARLAQEELLLRWRSLVENAPEIILTVGQTGCIEFINKSEIGYTTDRIIGQPLARFLPPSERERIATLLTQVFETNQPAAFEVQPLDPAGELSHWYSCRVGPICQQGQVESVVVIATNVSQHHQMEQQLRHSRVQLQRLTARQQAAIEEERRHISREVHDELGQLLTALKIELGWMENHLDEGPLLNHTHTMSGLVDTTMTTVRRIASRLRPPLLDELGPGPALDWLVQDACSRAGLEYSLQTSLSGRALNEEQSLALFRVCQEALTNVARHARATRVDVILRINEDQLELSIHDDGIGISNDQVTASLGLLGLQERVTMLGGSVSIGGSPGQGTRVEATIPLGPRQGPTEPKRTMGTHISPGESA
jgi:PAS domain S-box-containing protein